MKSLVAFSLTLSTLVACAGNVSLGSGVVIGADVTTLSAISPGNGWVPAPPNGSECKYGEQSFILTLATSSIKFSDCVDPGAGAALKFNSGSKSLSSAEVETVKAAFEALAPRGPNTNCLADSGGAYRVEIASPSKTQTYHDANWVCGAGGGIEAAENVIEVFTAMRKVAGLSQ